MALAVEHDVSANPPDVGPYRAFAVVAGAEACAYLVEQLGWLAEPWSAWPNPGRGRGMMLAVRWRFRSSDSVHPERCQPRAGRLRCNRFPHRPQRSSDCRSRLPYPPRPWFQTTKTGFSTGPRVVRSAETADSLGCFAVGNRKAPSRNRRLPSSQPLFSMAWLGSSLSSLRPQRKSSAISAATPRACSIS